MPRPAWGVCICQVPGHLSCSDLGRAQNIGQTESAPLWRTPEPEYEQLRPGKCMQPRAHFRQFPCRVTWSLSSVDWERTHAMSQGKPSVAETLQALPTHASDICLQCSSLSTALLNRSDQISRSVMSDSLRPHELQHARPPCPSPTPGVHSDSRPSSQ